jgi:hypothetical protein
MALCLNPLPTCLTFASLKTAYKILVFRNVQKFFLQVEPFNPCFGNLVAAKPGIKPTEEGLDVLQGLRSVLSDLGDAAISSPARMTFAAEGEILENALTKS